MGEQTPEERRAITRQKELSEHDSDELIAELDRRLEEQGVDMSLGNIKTVINYLREGWSLLAFPPEIADRVGGMTATPQSIAVIAAELRNLLAQKRQETPEPEAESLLTRVAKALYEVSRHIAAEPQTAALSAWDDIRLDDELAMQGRANAQALARTVIERG